MGRRRVRREAILVGRRKVREGSVGRLKVLVGLVDLEGRKGRISVGRRDRTLEVAGCLAVAPTLKVKAFSRRPVLLVAVREGRTGSWVGWETWRGTVRSRWLSCSNSRVADEGEVGAEGDGRRTHQ